MEINDAFILATRNAFRFVTPQGTLAVEDLWRLPLTSTRSDRANLDAIAIALNKELKESGDTTSFVEETTKTNDEAQAKFDIALYIIKAKKEEAKAAANERDRAAQKQRILEIIDQKKDESLAGKSLEDLTALLASL